MNISGPLTYTRLGASVDNGSINWFNSICWDPFMPWEQSWIMEIQHWKKSSTSSWTVLTQQWYRQRVLKMYVTCFCHLIRYQRCWFYLFRDIIPPIGRSHGHKRNYINIYRRNYLVWSLINKIWLNLKTTWIMIFLFKFSPGCLLMSKQKCLSTR